MTIIRLVRFRPYRRGFGPTFSLALYEVPGQSDRIGYDLVQHNPRIDRADCSACGGTGKVLLNGVARINSQAYSCTDCGPSQKRSHTVFTGSDFRPSPLHAWDSDETVAAVMGFLTLRLGDTDRDYFENYTAEQIEFRDSHAETLAWEVYSRFEAKEGK